MIKLVALDLDGTLLDAEKRIPAEAKKQLFDLKDRGVHIVLATGRTFESAKRYYYELELDTPFIGCNGGLVYLPEKKEILFGKVFSKKDFQSVAAMLAEHQVYYQYYGLDCIYAQELAFGVKRWKCENASLPENWQMKIELITDPVQWANDSYQPIYKVLARFASDSMMNHIAKKVNAMQGLDAVSSFSMALDIGPDQCTKGDALERVSGFLDIGLNETLAMGDHDNDCEMIEKAGIGIAVGEASEAAISVADRWLLNQNQEEIAEVLKELSDSLKRKGGRKS